MTPPGAPGGVRVLHAGDHPNTQEKSNTVSDEELPEFAVVVRGYDKQQVDDYVATLRLYLEEMTHRAHAAEQVTNERSSTTAMAAPTTPLALGEHVEMIVHAAHEAADRIRTEAMRRAEATADTEHQRVQHESAAVSRALAEADQITATARDEAETLLSRAREHAEQRAETLLEQAQAEADQLRLTATADAAAQVSHLTAEITQLEQRHTEVQSSLATLRSVLNGTTDSTATGSTGVGAGFPRTPTTPTGNEPHPSPPAAQRNP